MSKLKRFAAKKEFSDAMFCAWSQLNEARRLRLAGHQADADFGMRLVAVSRRRAAKAKVGA